MDRGSEWTFVQKRHTSGQQVCKKVLRITNSQGNANQNYSEISTHTCFKYTGVPKKGIHILRDVIFLAPSVIYKVEYYSATRKILPLVATWMDPEGIMLGMPIVCGI